jgi:hypothetical protein
MTHFDTTGYPALLAELLHQVPLAPLGPGKPHEDVGDRLKKVASAFPKGANPDMVAACRAGLYLAFDFLDEAHVVSQELETAEGSYWHALVHRREPDFANSAYWFRRVGTHPIFPALCAAAADLATGAPSRAAFLLRQSNWDAFAFVDLCRESYDDKAPCHSLCCQVQRIEWGLLFVYCYQHAVGGK